MDSPTIIELDSESLSQLIQRIEAAIEHDLALSVEDMKLLLLAITTLCTLQTKMEQDDLTLHKLRKLLGMIKQSESRRQNNDSSKKNRGHRGKSKRKPKDKKTKKTIVHHKMQKYHRGDICSACQRGKLYKHDPYKLLRITGHARYEAVEHIAEQFRCNGCQELYRAELPEEVLEDGAADQRYGYSARSIMCIDKFYTGSPYYHQSNLADIFGYSICASTIFDQCEKVADSVMSVYYELKRQASNAYQFLLDDTHNEILEQEPELRDKPNGKGQRLRTGIYTSGLIAMLEQGGEQYEIILFETSLGHAGEHLDGILKHRDPILPAPLTMSDALSNNSVTKVPVKSAYCNAHARRLFYDLESRYPDDSSWLLEQYAMIWQNETVVQEQKMSDDGRLAYHIEHSLPVMETIRDWAQKKSDSDRFEEHNAMGKAILYFLKHYERLIMFCVEPGALIDNNHMEERLKIVIRGRKTAHFYKTVNGAGVANVLISLISTAEQAGENIYEYLNALQRNQEKVKADPVAWLPWHYQKTLEALPGKLKPDKVA